MGTVKRKNDERLTRRIHTRITQAKYDQLSEVLKQSMGVRSLSELLRNILDDKPVVTRAYDATTEGLLQEIAVIRRELQAIGNNINQITHRFHIEDTAEGKLYRALEVAKLYQQTDLKISELFNAISKMTEQWWPKS